MQSNEELPLLAQNSSRAGSANEAQEIRVVISNHLKSYEELE